MHMIQQLDYRTYYHKFSKIQRVFTSFKFSIVINENYFLLDYHNDNNILDSLNLNLGPSSL